MVAAASQSPFTCRYRSSWGRTRSPCRSGFKPAVAEAASAAVDASAPGTVMPATLWRRTAAPPADHRGGAYASALVRIVVAECSVDYVGRLTAHLPLATRLLLLKADGSVLVHADGGSYKPLNWMSPPCSVEERAPEPEEAEAGVTRVWRVSSAKTGDVLSIRLHGVLADT